MESISIFIDQIINYLSGLGFIGGFALVILESIFPPIPLGVVVGLNMLSFGNIFGFLISYIATLTGCMLSFLLFRYVFKDKVDRWFSHKNRQLIKKWMDKLSEIDFNVLTVLLALPMTPAFLVNIAAGLSDLPMRKYLIAMIIAKPAMLLFYGYIAVSLVESITDPMNFLKVVGLAFGVYVVSKIIEKVVKVEK